MRKRNHELKRILIVATGAFVLSWLGTSPALAYRCQEDSLLTDGSPLSIARSLGETSMHTGLDDEAGITASSQVPMHLANIAVPTFDIPVVVNAQVVKWLEYFQGAGRKHFLRWLSRYERYSPMIIQVLREHGLPEDLVYLAMIESGFQPVARSHASAVGMWQFMRHTGSLYGLRVDWWVDERRDPFKATIAAAQHMSDLYEQFNSWYLVAASYNAGAGKISRAIRRYNTEDFWELSKTRFLRRETKDYVPKMLAAALIAKNPDAYGFREIHYLDPIQFEIFEVQQSTDLRKVAEALTISTEELRELNPELRHPYTPPDVVSYPLRVPVGSASTLATGVDVEQFKADLRKSHIVHTAKKGESLMSVARRYGVNSITLADLNSYSRRSRSRRLVPGTTIMVPMVDQNRDRDTTRIRRAAYTPKPTNKESMRYRVVSGDTLWSIAKRHNVTVTDLKTWNRAAQRNKIHPGMTLTIRKSY